MRGGSKGTHQNVCLGDPREPWRAPGQRVRWQVFQLYQSPAPSREVYMHTMGAAINRDNLATYR